MVGLACRMDFLFGHSFPLIIIGNHFYGSRLILCIHPHQTVAFLAFEICYGSRIRTIFSRYSQIFGTLTLTLAIDKHFCRRIICINKDRSHFSFTSRPCPMRKDMQRFFIFVPMTAVQIVTVFGQSGQVDDTEQRRMAGPISIIRSRFAQIIEARPYKFSDTPCVILMPNPVILRQIGPTTMFHIVRRRLMIVIFLHSLTDNREFIDATRTYCRSCFTT